MLKIGVKTNMEAIFNKQRETARRLGQQCAAIIANSTTPAGYCPTVWDGMICWPSAPPGQLSVFPCPSYIAGFNPERNASKQCQVEGSWFVNTTLNRTWTNYSQCISGRVALLPFPPIENPLIERYVPIMKSITHIGYGISLATLLVAFCIFALSKRLRCPRNKLHMHLFTSFMMRAFITLLKDWLFVNGLGLPSNFTIINKLYYFNYGSQSSMLCKLIVSLWQYFLMANYSWILMEGLYLHNLLFVSVFSDSSSILLYGVMGWGLPLLFVLPWAVVRAILENTLCWTINDNPYYYQLIKGPVTASVLVNIILLVNIERMLLSKLKVSVREETRRYRYRRWAKSTLVLVPLFGVHYVFFLVVENLDVRGSLEIILLFVDQLFTSFQGFFVAVLYCLLNGEVRQELERKWWHSSLRWRGKVERHRSSFPLTDTNRHNQQSGVTDSCISTMAANFSENSTPAHHQTQCPEKYEAGLLLEEHQ